jgi:hypothetical protein
MGGLGDEFKFHTISWSKVCSLISERGLRVQNLLLFNCALLGKWRWRFVHERDALWRIVVDTKYGSSWGGCYSYEVHGLYGVALWKNIRREWEEFSGHIGFEVGNSSKIRFWHDLCGDHALNNFFSVFYSIARAKDASIADYLELSSGSHQWNISFISAAHD